MPVLPGSLALTVIADGSLAVAADVRNNFTAIQTDVNALIALLANGNGLDGDPLVWDNTNAKWVAASTLASTRPRAPRVVTSTMAGGPPASPVDLDIWIATAVDGAGARWTFQYNAGSGSAFKWEFLGDTPLRSNVDTTEGTAVAGPVDLATVQSITVPRAGDYEADFGCQTQHNAAGGATLSLTITKAGVPLTGVTVNAPAANYIVTAARRGTTGFLGVAASDVFKAQYGTNGGATGFFLSRYLEITPIRIS